MLPLELLKVDGELSMKRFKLVALGAMVIVGHIGYRTIMFFISLWFIVTFKENTFSTYKGMCLDSDPF
jgi:hypothetical protein